MNYSVAVIIVSDRAATGVRKDKCLPVFEEQLSRHGLTLQESFIVSDDSDQILAALNQCIDAPYDLILTAGGTGCAPRDNTPEVTSRILDKPTPGVDEAIRRFSESKSPHAIFSRAVSGVAGKSYIVNLPGSPKAVGEILEFLLPRLKHPLGLISRSIIDCATEDNSNA